MQEVLLGARWPNLQLMQVAVPPGGRICNSQVAKFVTHKGCHLVTKFETDASGTNKPPNWDKRELRNTGSIISK